MQCSKFFRGAAGLQPACNQLAPINRQIGRPDNIACWWYPQHWQVMSELYWTCEVINLQASARPPGKRQGWGRCVWQCDDLQWQSTKSVLQLGYGEWQGGCCSSCWSQDHGSHSWIEVRAFHLLDDPLRLHHIIATVYSLTNPFLMLNWDACNWRNTHFSGLWNIMKHPWSFKNLLVSHRSNKCSCTACPNLCLFLRFGSHEAVSLLLAKDISSCQLDAEICAISSALWVRIELSSMYMCAHIGLVICGLSPSDITSADFQNLRQLLIALAIPQVSYRGLPQSQISSLWEEPEGISAWIQETATSFLLENLV